MYISNIEPSGSIPPEVFLYKKDMPRLTLPSKTIEYRFVRGLCLTQHPRQGSHVKITVLTVIFSGAASRNRTKDTGIFSPLLYQLS